MLIRKAEILTALGKSTISDAEEALLDLVHPWAEAALKNWLQNALEYAQHVEYLPLGIPDVSNEEVPLEDAELVGNVVVFPSRVLGGDVLQLAHTPVWLTGLTVYEDPGAYAGQVSGAFASGTLLTGGTDYYLDVDDATNNISNSGLLYRNGEWPVEPRSVKVTYYGGETAARLAGAQSDIKLAATLTVIKAFKQLSNLQKGNGPLTSESIGKYSVGFAAGSSEAMAGAGATVPPEAQAILWKYRSFAGCFGV